MILITCFVGGSEVAPIVWTRVRLNATVPVDVVGDALFTTSRVSAPIVRAIMFFHSEVGVIFFDRVIWLLFFPANLFIFCRCSVDRHRLSSSEKACQDVGIGDDTVRCVYVRPYQPRRSRM